MVFENLLKAFLCEVELFEKQQKIRDMIPQLSFFSNVSLPTILFDY